MARTAPVGGGGNWAKPEVGPQAVRCFAFIDLGTQEVQWQGSVKHQHKVLLGFEILGSDNGDGAPFTLWKRFTFSMHEKAALRKFLASWRGKPFDDAEAGAFDVAVLAERGTAGLANVVHNERDGNTYANIDSIMPLPKGMQAPERTIPTVIFDLDNYDPKVFSEFRDSLKDTIKKSPEWIKMNAHGQTAQDDGFGGGAYDSEQPPFDPDEPVPF